MQLIAQDFIYVNTAPDGTMIYKKLNNMEMKQTSLQNPLYFSEIVLFYAISLEKSTLKSFKSASVEIANLVARLLIWIKGA